MISTFRTRVLLLSLGLLGSLSISAQLSQTRKNDQDIFDVNKNIQILTEVLYNLQTYSLYDIDPNTITKTGVTSMMASIDPYTRFYSESDIQDYLYQRTGKYEGLGLSFFKGVDSSIVISDIIAGGEAENSGLVIGDTIISVNGVELYPMNAGAVRDYFQKINGEDIQLSIKKAYSGVQQNVSIDKGVVKKYKLGYAGWLDSDSKKTSIVKLDKFTPNCAADVEHALDSLYLLNPEMKNIILDLRSNPGGLLMEAVYLVNLFVGPGKLVVYTQGKIDDDTKKYKTQKNAKYEDQNLYVLIDTHSASASEIVSGSLQDYDRGVLVGQNSYGKGLVQNFKQLPFHTQMKLTTAKYYIPSGRCIQTLDYGDKDENGNAYIKPESKRNAFQTSNGREVLDGRGVTPDVEIPLQFSDLISELISKHVIFEFVSDEIDIPNIKKNMDNSDLKNYTEEFYTWLPKSNSWKILTHFEYWQKLKTQNDNSQIIPLPDIEKFENQMAFSLIEKIKEEESQLQNAIRDEVLRRTLSGYKAYEENIETDSYILKVKEIMASGNQYEKILQN